MLVPRRRPTQAIDLYIRTQSSKNWKPKIKRPETPNLLTLPWRTSTPLDSLNTTLAAASRIDSTTLAKNSSAHTTPPSRFTFFSILTSRQYRPSTFLTFQPPALQSRPQPQTNTNSNSKTHQQTTSIMDFVKQFTGGDENKNQQGQQSQQGQEQKSSGGGFFDKLNSAAGGGRESEKNEDGLDKAVDFFQEKVLGQGPQDNELVSPFLIHIPPSPPLHKK